jgi:hypothetical protein
MTRVTKLSRRLARGQQALGDIAKERTVKRFSIMARPFEQNYDVEVCQCDSNPEVIVAATRKKTIKVVGKPRPAYVTQYEHVYVKENT